MKGILINISKANLFKNFFKFPKANILFTFLVFGFSEWIISDLFNFSGGNLGFILLFQPRLGLIFPAMAAAVSKSFVKG